MGLVGPKAVVAFEEEDLVGLKVVVAQVGSIEVDGQLGLMLVGHMMAEDGQDLVVVGQEVQVVAGVAVVGMVARGCCIGQEVAYCFRVS